MCPDVHRLHMQADPEEDRAFVRVG
jgi:hypothetical protein